MSLYDNGLASGQVVQAVHVLRHMLILREASAVAGVILSGEIVEL